MRAKSLKVRKSGKHDYPIIGASLSEPHVVRLAAEISVVCLSVCLLPYVVVRPKKIAASIGIRALILHLAGDNLAASMRITCGIHYKHKTKTKKI